MRAVTEQPWLTVVTIVKDDADGFARTMRSLALQDLEGVELIVVDSSAIQTDVDDVLVSTHIADRIPRLTVERTAPAGIYAAMNRGLDLANGQFTYYLNSGDELSSASGISDVRAAVTSKEPTWLFGPAEIVQLDGTEIVTPPWDYPAERESGFSNGHFPGHQSTIASTLSLREIGGFDTSYRIAADYDAFLQLSTMADPAIVSKPIGRFHEGGASTVSWFRSIIEFHRARTKRLNLTGWAAVQEKFATARQLLRVSAHRSPWPIAMVLALITWVAMLLWGVSLVTATLLTAAVAWQGLGGALWWRESQPRRSVSILELIGVGLGLGTAGAMLIGLLGTWWALTPVVALIWALRRRRGQLAPLLPLGRPELVALIVGLVPGLAATGWAIRNYPLTWTGTWSGYHGDMPFFEALSTSVARLGPGASIFMDGAELRYHSLAYGWAGQLSQSVGAEPFVVLTRLLPIVMLIGTIAIAAAWTRALAPKTTWAPSLAVALIVTGGFVGATFGGILNFDSPSQSVGTVWLLALSVLYLRALQPESSPWLGLPLVALAVALTGGKVSTAAIAGVGIGLVALVGLVRSAWWRGRALVFAGITAASMAGTYVWLLAGSANAGGLELFTLLDRASSVQSLNPVITPRGIAAGILILAIAIIPRWAGLVWLVVDRRTRWEPASVYGFGLAVGALIALIALSGGFNDLWFAVAASAPLAVLSAVGVTSAVSALTPAVRGRVWWAVLAGLGIAVVVAGLWTTGSTGIIGNGWRWFGPIAGATLAVLVGLIVARAVGATGSTGGLAVVLVVLVSTALPSKLLYGLATPFAPIPEGSMSTVLFALEPDYIETIDRERPTGWSHTQAEAGAWLRANTGLDSLVATNVTLSAIVPALSQRTTFISDVHMQAPYGRSSDTGEIQRREQASWKFIDSPSTESLAPLCAAGVDWLWVDPSRTSTRDWSSFATVAFEVEDVIVLEIESSAC